MNLFALLDQAAARFGDRGALYLGEHQRCTWAELRDRVLRLATSIGGLGPAVFSALLGGVLLNYFFVPPIYSLTIAAPENLITLITMMVVAVEDWISAVAPAPVRSAANRFAVRCVRICRSRAPASRWSPSPVCCIP